MTATAPSVLDRIDVEAPCSVAWDSMSRTCDERVRFCGECRLEVWNISGMSRDEADGLVRSRLGAGGSLCARFARRDDGTVVTEDCGPVRRAVRRRVARLRLAVAGLAAMFFPVAGCAPARPADDDRTPAAIPLVKKPSPAVVALPAPKAPEPLPLTSEKPCCVPAPTPTEKPAESPSQTAPEPTPSPAPQPEEKPPTREIVTGKLCLRPSAGDGAYTA